MVKKSELKRYLKDTNASTNATKAVQFRGLLCKASQRVNATVFTKANTFPGTVEINRKKSEQK